MNRLAPLLLAVWLMPACSAGPQPDAGKQPHAVADATTSWDKGAMITAANPYAADAAARVIAAGGHAVDAAIAAHAVLGLVEPQSSGIGGGAFMLVFERASGRISVYDGRETAPAGADQKMFFVDGAVMGFREAWQSGVAIGVPGTIAMYKTAHERHGRLAWPQTLAPAIELADDGFVVSPRLHDLLVRFAPYSLLDEHPASAAYFYPDGEALPVGYVRRNADYATTLRAVAERGPSAFYTGKLANAIAAAARAEPHPGTLTSDDLAAYEVKIREPICGAFRHYKICSAPPPSSGIAQIMIAALYDRLTADQLPDQFEQLRAFVDAQRLAYADRDHYIADADFVAVPAQDLIAAKYLDARAAQRFAPDADATAGDPGAVLRGKPLAARFGQDTTHEVAGTSHLSIIDRAGNAVVLTASVEAPFGTSRFVGGFLLNNQMTDFARDPIVDGALAANAAAPGKRARSSMSPTLVFDENGDLVMATGSPGGNSIVAYVAKTTLGVLAWQQTAQAAIDSPNIVARGNQVRVETINDSAKAFAAYLTELGYEVRESAGENSGLHTIVVRDNGLEGGADPRREGRVATVP